MYGITTIHPSSTVTQIQPNTSLVDTIVLLLDFICDFIRWIFPITRLQDLSKTLKINSISIQLCLEGTYHFLVIH